MNVNILSLFAHVKRVPVNYMELTLIMGMENNFLDNVKKKDVLFWVLSSYIMWVKLMRLCKAMHISPLTHGIYVILFSHFDGTLLFGK